jgi:septal ring factor EnvC (AmiA/AmiB activator)
MNYVMEKVKAVCGSVAEFCTKYWKLIMGVVVLAFTAIAMLFKGKVGKKPDEKALGDAIDTYTAESTKALEEIEKKTKKLETHVAATNAAVETFAKKVEAIDANKEETNASTDDFVNRNNH